jgi:zinc protease
MDGDELARSTEILGGSVSPQVGVESLGWGLTVRPAGLERAAAVLRALALEPHLNAEEVRVERELQASDATRMRDNMFHYPIQRVLGQAFPGHAYGFPSLGEPETLLTITQDDVRAWADAAVTTRPVVLVVGDCSAEDAVGMLGPLTSWPAGSPIRQPAYPPIRPCANPPTWTPGRGSESRQKQQTALAMAFPCAAFGSPDRFPLTVVGAVLSGLAGRLFDELREKRSLAYTVAAFPWLVRRAGAVLGYIATSPEREEEARSAMLTELARLINEPPASEELDRARNYAAGSVELRQQTGRAVAAEILEAWVHGSLDTVAETATRLRAVTRDDVARIAAEVFDAEQRAEYVVRGG